MSPSERDELLAVARELDAFGLRRNAGRLRALADADQAQDERPCPIQDDRNEFRAIPWGLAEMLYSVYDAGGYDQSLERLAERGGFSRGELGRLAVGFYIDGQRAMRGYANRMPLLDLYEMAKRAAPAPPDQDGATDAR